MALTVDSLYFCKGETAAVGHCDHKRNNLIGHCTHSCVLHTRLPLVPSARASWYMVVIEMVYGRCQ
jgi:hypothetical protein